VRSLNPPLSELLLSRKECAIDPDRAPPREALDEWFANEILPHEAALLRYLQRVWPNRHELQDLRQDIYVRVYEAAMKSRPISPKSFLFSTARHLLIDRIRRSRVVSIHYVGDLLELNVLPDELTPERCASAGQELGVLASAFRRLPPREREAVWLRRVKDLSQQEVAERMGISQKTVETHLRRALHAMANALHLRCGDGD
jgi:RNA polymerase sigma factor (sigma-70 family)